MIAEDLNITADAMFIADLHLHPNMPEISKKFFSFIKWSASRTRSLYILGDFLHVWPGDEAIDEWSDEISKCLSWLSSQGVTVYFMAGNRDFLLSDKFITKSKMQEIADVTIIKLGDKKVLLSHGDRYCTKDISHQFLRILTRNRIFKFLFLKTPYKFRCKIVNKVRQYSQSGRFKSAKNMHTVSTAIIKHLSHFKVDTIIHGHTHMPGLTKHSDEKGDFYQYVLSDWDEKPLIMCYNKPNNFYYSLFVGDV